MTRDIQNLQSEYDSFVGIRRELNVDLKHSRKELRELYIRREQLLKARAALLLFSKSVQEEIKEQIENMITSALTTVLRDRLYEFKLEFKTRKNRVDCIPVVYEGKARMIPKDDMGGGSWPVIGFPLRVVFLGNNRPMIWLDEPLKGALGRENDLMLMALRVFKDVSIKLGIQVIISSHEHDFEEIADNVIRIKHNGRHSIIEKVRRVIKR